MAVALLRKVFVEVTSISLRRTSVEEVISADVALVPDSADPAPDRQNGRRQTWIANYVPRDRVTLTYDVRPLRFGDIRPSTATTVTTESRDGLTWLSLPSPVIRVDLAQSVDLPWFAAPE